MLPDELLATYLSYGLEAARDLDRRDPDTAAWDTSANGVIVSFTIAALLAEVRALDPDRAAELVPLISDTLDSTGATTALLHHWARELNAGREFRLTEVPEPQADGGWQVVPVDDEAQAAQSARATELLNRLHPHNPAAAQAIHNRWADPVDPTGPLDVIREATSHLNSLAPAAPARPRHEHLAPRRTP